jgi:putative FmdB family regulatory protein
MTGAPFVFPGWSFSIAPKAAPCYHLPSLIMLCCQYAWQAAVNVEETDVPTYTYGCKKCGHAFDVFHAMSATPKIACESCGSARTERHLGTGSGFIFKGSGFYETDFKEKKGTPPKTETTTEKKADTAAKAETKPAAKSESTPAKATGSKAAPAA